MIKRGAADLKQVGSLAPPAHFNTRKWFHHISMLLKAGAFVLYLWFGVLCLVLEYFLCADLFVKLCLKDLLECFRKRYNYNVFIVTLAVTVSYLCLWAYIVTLFLRFCAKILLLRDWRPMRRLSR